jgi:hypothetical protein
MTPEAPEIVLGSFFVGWRGDGDDLVRPRVQRSSDPPDRATLAGRVQPFEYQDRGDSLLLGPALQEIEPALILLEIVAKTFLETACDMSRLLRIVGAAAADPRIRAAVAGCDPDNAAVARRA